MHPCALCIHLCFNHEKNTIPGTESMHELMLSIFNIKLEANEELNGLIQVGCLPSEIIQIAIDIFSSSVPTVIRIIATFSAVRIFGKSKTNRIFV